MNNREQIVDWLVTNKPYILEKTDNFRVIKEHLLEENPIEFWDLILEEYYDTIEFAIETEISKALAISIEDVKMVLEDINLGDYLS